MIQILFQRLESSRIQKKLFAFTDHKYYYSDLTTGVKQLSSVFNSNNLVLGKRALISSSDSYIVSLIFLTCLRNGVTAILLDPETVPGKAEKIVNRIEPDAFFVDSNLVANWSLVEKQEYVHKIVLGSAKKTPFLKRLFGSDNGLGAKGEKSFLDELKEMNEGIYPESVDQSTIAYILFTSGTTSLPKAVQISHGALFHNLSTISKVYRIEESSRIFNLLPLYHTDGMMQGPVLSAFNAVTWYRPFEFSVRQISDIFDAFIKYKISHFITVPTMLAFMDKFSSGYEDSFETDYFKYIVTSASILEKQLWQLIESKFKTEVVNVYGLTETVISSSYCGPDKETRKIGSIGKPIDCEYKIIDEEGNELTQGGKGELLIKGENLLTGYLNNKEATDAALKDGWFHTGDIVTKDENGFYYIIGRKKNLVISGGINIQPEEVSEAITTHPNIMEAICFGVEDSLFGEKLIGCVVMKSDVSLSEIELIDYCRSKLEPIKIPKNIYFLDHLPKTISGKVRVSDVKKLLQEKVPRSLTNPKNIREQILESASKVFKIPIDQLDLSCSSKTVDGWDSMAHMLFVADLEKKFKVNINFKEIMILDTLQSTEELLLKKLSR